MCLRRIRNAPTRREKVIATAKAKRMESRLDATIEAVDDYNAASCERTAVLIMRLPKMTKPRRKRSPLPVAAENEIIRAIRLPE